ARPTMHSSERTCLRPQSSSRELDTIDSESQKGQMGHMNYPPNCPTHDRTFGAQNEISCEDVWLVIKEMARAVWFGTRKSQVQNLLCQRETRKAAKSGSPGAVGRSRCRRQEVGSFGLP